MKCNKKQDVWNEGCPGVLKFENRLLVLEQQILTGDRNENVRKFVITNT
jgi:hypothetical protein